MPDLKVDINLPDSVDNAAKNLTDDLSLNMGKTLSDIWYLIFGSLSHAADKRRMQYAAELDAFRKELETSISKIPEERKIDPSVHVAAQALEHAKYCVDEEKLREMFVSLISNSMDSAFSDEVHPSFSDVIRQMSSLDARILKLFLPKNILGLPVCQYKYTFPDNNGYNAFPEHIFMELPDVDIIPCSRSLSSLSRLGLISISYNKWISGPSVYEKFTDDPLFKKIQGEIPIGTISIIKGIASITPFGRAFTNVCIPD